MTIDDEISRTIIGEVGRTYEVRRGQVVPRSEAVGQSQGVLLSATYLYADLADSSKLAQMANYIDAAKVLKTYISVAVRLIRYKDGHIRSFDGDRVMGIFIGDDQETRAARTALALNAYVETMRLWIPEDLPSLAASSWKLNHGVGIATGDALLVTAGIRNSGDIISIGSAANVAAKLSDIRDDGYPLHITETTWDGMSWDTCFKNGSPPNKYESATSMWESLGYFKAGGRTFAYRGSTFRWPYK